VGLFCLKEERIFHLKNIEDHIPYYLTADKKQALINALRRFPLEGATYCQTGHSDEALQGDCWSGFEAVNFDTLKKRSLQGIILSNSCDISPDNKRDFPPNVTFAPMVPLSQYMQMLVDKGLAPDKVDSKVSAIRSQHYTNMFFLPRCQYLDQDYVVLFDHIQTMPYQAFAGSQAKQRKSMLTMVGFYIFIFKLSFHFCRFHEEVDRE
jgi:hypothetical protein